MNVADTGESGTINRAGSSIAPFDWRPWAAALILICCIPLILLGAGVGLSTVGSVAATDGLTAADFVEAAHQTLRGSFTHTILEWTATCIAALVALLAFVHYRLKSEPSVPIIGMALMCAGGIDAFHTLAADRLISTVADTRDLIPLTWALSRLFNATILLVGVAIILWRPRATTRRRGWLMVGVSAAFVPAAYFIIAACAASNTLPRTIFPEAIVKRPYDLYPLLPYLACALIAFPLYNRRHPSVFAKTLMLALIPAFATQFYMAFGSYALHDACFNIAHATKALSYAVPLLGFLLDYNQTYRDHQTTEHNLLASIREIRRQHIELATMQARTEEANRELSKYTEALEKARRASVNTIADVQAARHMADSANEAKSEFLANMSHEIRTPMTAILGFAESMLDGDQSESQRQQCVHTIRRNGEYLLGIINNILDLSKIEAGIMDVERIACRPCELIAEVASLMRIRVDAKGFALNIEYANAIPETIATDPTRVRQILINLIGNAVKFTNDGEVRLIVRFVGNAEDDRGGSSNEPGLQFDLLDTGQGMSDEQIANLFRPFTQADTSTSRKFGGAGLGLAISKRFAELLGGDINLVESKVGVGTRFRVTVATGPLDGVRMLEDPMSATVAADKARTVTQIPPADLHGYRILLAEDGPDNQRLITRVLKKAGGEVSLAENGKIAVDEVLTALARNRPYDVILMDMQMPVLDGYAATTLLRKDGYAGPIVALTAHAMTGDREKCVAAGCDEHLTKPIDRAMLIHVVAAWAEKTRTGSGLQSLVPP